MANTTQPSNNQPSHKAPNTLQFGSNNLNNEADAQYVFKHLNKLQPKPPSIPIIVLGYGNIGQSFIKLLQKNKQQIEHQLKQSLSLVAVCNSKKQAFNQKGLLHQRIELTENNQLIEQLNTFKGKEAIIVDLTASNEIAEQYPNWATSGWHIISANKAAAADIELAKVTRQIAKQQKRKWLKNTTVGAALPIQSTIEKISQSGDTITKISGVFSGSLSWLLNNYKGQQFTHWIKKAKSQGYSEPDPRDDLSGNDVYRKALILAQEAGFSPQHVNFKPLLPAQFLQGELADFWLQHESIDQHVFNLWQQAQNDGGKQLSYLAEITSDEVVIGLKALPKNHPASQIKAGDNVFVIESHNYDSNPIVIQGPGAGREVTAAGVLNDLIAILKID